MTTNLLLFRQEMTVPDAVKALIKRGVSGAPVVGEAGELVGVISELDCMKVLATTEFYQQAALSVSTVGELMSKGAYTISPEIDLYAIVQKFTEYRIRRLPVLDGERLIGLVSRRDVLRAMRELFA